MGAGVGGAAGRVAGLAAAAWLGVAAAAAGQGAEATGEAWLRVLCAASDDTATEARHGRELWISDLTLTATGTAMVADIAPGSASSLPTAITPIGGGLAVFVADDGASGREPWVSDGTAEGTRRLADIRPGPPAGAPEWLTDTGHGFAAFSADDGVTGRELWVSDGTPLGTRLRGDLASGPTASSPADLVRVGADDMVFVAEGRCIGGGTCRDLYSWNLSGDTIVAHATRRRDVAWQPRGLVPLGDGRVLFGAFTAADGREPWVASVSRMSARRVKDILPGAEGSDPGGFAALGGGGAVFAATTPLRGRELWYTDGTRAGTRLVRDILPGPRSSSPEFLTSASPGTALFAARSAAGRELWITDGTRAGTRLVRDLMRGAGDGLGADGTNPFIAPLGDGRAVFAAADGPGNAEPWVTDGSARGTRRLGELSPGATGSDPADITPTGDGRAVFGARGTAGDEPWVTGGRARNTRLVADTIDCEGCGSAPRGFAPLR